MATAEEQRPDRETHGDNEKNSQQSVAAADAKSTIGSRGDFDREHRRLMDLQNEQEQEDRLLAEAEDFVLRGRQLGAYLEEPASRHDCQGILNYWAIFIYREKQVQVESDLLPFNPDLTPSLDDARFPYRFEEGIEADAENKLGWQRLLDECEQKLVEQSFLTVVGNSGDGRRMFVHKLLVPALQSGDARRTELRRINHWRCYNVELGQQPVRDIVESVAAQEGRDQNWVEERIKGMRRDETGLQSTLDEADGEGVVLVLDRLENVLQSSTAERDAFLNNLYTLISDPDAGFYVIATIRRDCPLRASNFGPLEGPLRESQVLMAFTSGELRHMIQDPARRIGLVFERGLVDQILIDVQGEPTALPLLQFTLNRLWQRRQNSRITWAAYNEVGAGRTALRIAIEDVYENFDDEHREVLKRMLLALVNLGPDGTFEMCDLTGTDLERVGGNAGQIRTIVDMLVQEDLLRTRTVDGQSGYGIRYAALPASWPRFIDWLDDVRVEHRFRLRLRQDAVRWRENEEPKDLLWRGLSLAEASRQFDQDATLTEDERDFLHSSKRHQLIVRALWISMLSAAVALLFAAIIGAVSADAQRAKAEQAETEASLQLAEADFQRANAAKERAEFDRERAKAEKRAGEVREQQRIIADAAERLRDGDLAGTLLWLSKAENGENAAYLKRMREIVEAQLPNVDMLFANDDSAADSKPVIQATAVLPDKQLFAIVKREGFEAPYKYFPEVFRLRQDSGSLFEKVWPVNGTDPPELSGDKKSRGEVAFALNGNCLIFAAGERVRAWRIVRNQNGDQSLSFEEAELDFKPLDNSSLVAVGSDGDSLLFTLERVHEEDTRRLRLWKIIQESGADASTLQLHQLYQFDDENVRSASLSSEGHLLTLCAPDDATQPVHLKVRIRVPRFDRWTLASAPEFARKTASADPQRARDWGWQPTNGGWQKIGSYIRSASFNSSGREFVTACDNGEVRVWEIVVPSDSELIFSFFGWQLLDARKGSVIPQFEKTLRLGASVFDAAFLADDLVITAGRDRTARIWDIRAAVEIAPRMYHEGTVSNVAYAGDGKIVTRTGKILRVWQSTAFEKLANPMEAGFVELSGDHETVVFADRSADLRINQLGGRGTSYIVERDGDVRSIQLSHDGDKVLFASQTTGKDVVKMMMIEFPFADAAVDLGKQFRSVPLAAFSVSGDLIAVAEKEGRYGMPRSMHVWDLRKRFGDWLDAPDEIDLATLLPDKHAVEITDLEFGRFNGEDVLVIVGEENPKSNNSQGTIYLCTKRDSAAGNGAEFRVVRLTEKPTDGKNVTSAHLDRVLFAKFSGDGSLLVTGDRNDKAKVWRVEEILKLIATSDEAALAPTSQVFEHTSDVIGASFIKQPDGVRKLVTISSEGEATVWTDVTDTGNFDVEKRLTITHDAKILAASFSEDGQWIITAGQDRTARIWDSSTGRLVGYLILSGPVRNAAFIGSNEVITISESPRLSVARSEKEGEGTEGLSLLERQRWVLELPESQIDDETLARISCRKVSDNRSGLDHLDADVLREPARQPETITGK